MTNVIQRIVMTEKSSGSVPSHKYTFYVNVSANKIQIKQEVEKMFNVEVVDVNTVRLPGKARRRGKVIGFTSPRKKAIVTVKQTPNEESLKALY